MFDKMKQLMQMQKSIAEMKRQLDAATFKAAGPDGAVTITMNGSQIVQAVTLSPEALGMKKEILEKSLKDAYNRAIKQSHDLAASKMKEITGFNLPGMG